MVASAAGEVIAADSLGKAKTAVTMVSLCGFYVAFALEALGMGDLTVWILGISQALMVAAVVLTKRPSARRSFRESSTSGMLATSCLGFNDGHSV